ncbi:MAG: symporter small accessory protein [Candidatus Methanofastidiosia archaeon]
MFGIEDPQILLGYITSIVFALACALYGAMNWNKGGNENGN